VLLHNILRTCALRICSVRSRENTGSPTIRDLTRTIQIRATLPYHKQQQPAYIIYTPHPALRDLVRPIYGIDSTRHVTRIRPRTHNVTPNSPLAQKRRHNLAQLRGRSFRSVVCQPCTDPAHVGCDRGDGDDVRHAVIIFLYSDVLELACIALTGIAGAGYAARGPAAAGVCGLEEGKEECGYADDSFGVDLESLRPFVALHAKDHGVADRLDGCGIVDGLARLGAQDAGVVDQDVDVAGLLLDMGDGGADGGEVCYVGGDGGEDGRGFGCRGRGLEPRNGIFEDIFAAADDVDFGRAVLIQRRGNGEADAFIGGALVCC
jgi:hypothetical protein